MKSLTNLSYLGLDNNQISDISSIASLTNLKRLMLHNNQINDESYIVSRFFYYSHQ
ncbi:MAG: leucine-rich repeat domain-containing protein [Gammaproteobacteria bacterium]